MRHMLLAATALVMLSSAAYAQTSSSGSHSQSSATNASASTSSSMSNPRVNVIGNPIGNGASSSSSAARATANTQSRSQSSAVGNRSNIVVNTYAGVDGSGNSSSGARASAGGASGNGATTPAGDPAYSIDYSGGYSIHNVPEVIPPNVVGGNPCAVGASGGLAVSGFGIAGGATWADKQCERRQQAALLYNIGKPRAATELMCQDDNVRAALRVAGEPCAADQVQQPAAHAAATAPVLAAPVAAPVTAEKVRPEWCYTASPAELRRHTECNVAL